MRFVSSYRNRDSGLGVRDSGFGTRGSGTRVRHQEVEARLDAP
jgi:hypothetical protein